MQAYVTTILFVYIQIYMSSINGISNYTVKRVDEVVRHWHLVTQDQFTQVSKKVSDIPKEYFTIKYRTFPAFFTSAELVRYDYISHVELFR